MKPERSLVSSKTWAFFWSVLFLIQENVSNCSQFESTLQLLQDFFSHSLKISKNKSVTTSKPAICSKIRHFFFRVQNNKNIILIILRRKRKGQNGLGESYPRSFLRSLRLSSSSKALKIFSVSKPRTFRDIAVLSPFSRSTVPPMVLFASLFLS